MHSLIVNLLRVTTHFPRRSRDLIHYTLHSSTWRAATETNYKPPTFPVSSRGR